MAELADFDRALAELGESGPVYAFERGEDGSITFHLPSKTVTWLGQHPASRIEHPASRIEHPASSIELPAPGTQHPALSTEDFTAISGVSDEIAAALHNAGFYTFNDLVHASDVALLNVAGIGKATLRRIRDYLKDHYL